jgi:hypothetical protein
MTGGQILVFWCGLAGLVVVFCAEVFRAWHRSRPLGRTPHERLMQEIRHKGADDESPH